ncbi:MAG TPA: zf-HC2 domain-containing protein [Vicinamibacteria bacterium]|nr:zf-HC2 domain-containing protein [Vicinamibacteria bacterium]
MTHPSPGALLELHFGEAPGDEREAFEAHLRGCRECASFVQELGRIERALAGGPDDAPPRDGLERVLARVAAVRPARGRRAEWAVALVPSALALLAGAWAIRAGGERLTTLGLVTGASLGPVSGELLGLSLAAFGLVVVGALITLALAPVLILESHGRS